MISLDAIVNDNNKVKIILEIKSNNIMNDFLTVEQLINKLKSYPNDVRVLVGGYEDGLDAILDVSIVNVKYDDAKKWYYGPFEECDNCNEIALKILSTRGSKT